jgi:hypothetical protein
LIVNRLALVTLASWAKRHGQPPNRLSLFCDRLQSSSMSPRPLPIWAGAQSANGEFGADTRNPLIRLRSRNGGVAALSEAQGDQEHTS